LRIETLRLYRRVSGEVDRARDRQRRIDQPRAAAEWLAKERNYAMSQENYSLAMTTDEMRRLFERHRDAELARNYDGILDTFVDDCFLDTKPLGLRSEGREAVRRSYEEGYFAAFPDLAPEDIGEAFGADVMVVWGFLRGTSRGEWMGIPPTGRSFDVPFANVTPFRDGLMEGEAIYFDLATLCDQAGFPLDEIRENARQRSGA
jgi:predicted ester cyclase